MIIPTLDWWSIIAKVFVVFAYWAGVSLIYLFAKSAVGVGRKSKHVPATLLEKIWNYICCFGICLIIALALGSQLGTHTEGGDDYMDPGETVVDYVASEKAKWTCKSPETMTTH